MSEELRSCEAPLLSSPASHSAYGSSDRQVQSRNEERGQQHDDSNIGPLRGIFLDHTFSAAMMHSVGSLGRDEYVDDRGVIHLVSIRKRRRKTVASGAPALSNETTTSSYGNLKNLFHRETPKQQDIDDKRTLIAKCQGDEDDEELEVQDQVEGGSITAAIFGIVKGTVGPAILYLPKGFQQAGWACALPALVLSTFAYVYSAHRLLQCWKVEEVRQQFLAQRMGEIQKILERHNSIDYKDPNDHKMRGERAGSKHSVSHLQASPSEDDRRAEALTAFKPKLLTYPELARRAFGPFAFLIEFGIAAMQFGVCLTYLIFVPANLYASCQALFGVAIPKSYFLVGMLCIEIPCTFIRDIRRLTPFNVFATILIVYGLGSCLLISFIYSFTQKEEPLFESVISLPAIQPAWFIFIGTAFFVFEGSITLVVPLQEAVYKKDDRERFPMVNQNVTISIVLFYMFFALVVWATFEDQVQTALTASLPPGHFSTSVQFAYSIAVVLTYPLQAFPALEVVLRKHGATASTGIWNRRNFYAGLLNVGLGIIAIIAIDYLGNVVSLLGSLVGMPIALVYPPMMHNFLVKDSSATERCLNHLVSIIGLIATVAASYATISNWNEGGD
ncbi:unnamed protein product [Pseudo-nitzschia multistriata]|uniref:Amino acid transporter transmembrane domain-containing protein n=1 Tax=Pseudo-nitzschia multistriata TaxID=183589 RepID=A0A448ZII6_9STRA|nr:unnamed protein product [Pseudo-nitzschia multistriata]